MDPQQIYAYLGQWYDIVGRGGGGGGGGGRGRGGMGGGNAARGTYGGRGGGMAGSGGGGSVAYRPYPGWDNRFKPGGLYNPKLTPPKQTPTPPPPPPPPPPSTPIQGWYDLTGPMVGQLPPGGFPFPAAAAVVAAPMPTQANRDILPMSTGVPILPTQSAQITGRPQVLVFKIGRFVISNAGTAGGAADWIVNDIKIGNRSQFVQSGDVPGDLFATNAIDTFVRFESAQTAMDVVVVVTYIGLNESGAPFFGAMVGTAAI